MNRLAPRRTPGSTTAIPGRVLRPVVGVDIDGTLGQWHAAFIRFAAQYLQRNILTEWTGEQPFFQHLGVSKTTYRRLKLAFRQSGLKRGMEPLPGAVTFARGIRQAGAELWVCTTRPYLRLDNIDPDTRWWLRHHGITYDGVLFGEKKYRDLVSLVGVSRIVGVLDDLPEQVEAAMAMHLTARLLERPYNSVNHHGLLAVSSLTVAQKQFEEDIAVYLKEHNVRGK